MAEPSEDNEHLGVVISGADVASLVMHKGGGAGNPCWQGMRGSQEGDPQTREEP